AHPPPGRPARPGDAGGRARGRGRRLAWGPADDPRWERPAAAPTGSAGGAEGATTPEPLRHQGPSGRGSSGARRATEGEPPAPPAPPAPPTSDPTSRPEPHREHQRRALRRPPHR